MDMIDISKWLPYLRDPVDLQELHFLAGPPPQLQGGESGLIYDFVGPFPDLRPEAGHRPGEFSTSPQPESLEQNVSIVRNHYDSKPCHNYLHLDNIPLGKYLRDPRYDGFFRDLDFAVEVGSGKGMIAEAFLQQKGLKLFCVDLAYGSLRHIRREPLCADGLLGSNLRLPLADQVADLVVSYGVIHHTPNPFQCLRELARILKPGGKLLLNVYNWGTFYRSLYFFLNPPFRLILTSLGEKWGNWVLKWTAFWPYYLTLWAVLGIVQGKWQSPDVSNAWEQFGDFFLTPIAHFYHAPELITMGEVLGLRLLEHETGGWPKNSFSHFFWFEKI